MAGFAGCRQKKECKRRKEMKETGGGLPPHELSELDKKVVSLIPQSMLDGIDGGTDSHILITQGGLENIGAHGNSTLNFINSRPLAIANTQKSLPKAVTETVGVTSVATERQKLSVKGVTKTSVSGVTKTSVSGVTKSSDSNRLEMERRKMEILEELLKI